MKRFSSLKRDMAKRGNRCAACYFSGFIYFDLVYTFLIPFYILLTILPTGDAKCQKTT